MKAVKLSLAAALVASSAFAVENVKVDGQLKLWYQTVESSAKGSANLFEQGASSGDFVAKVGVTGNLTKKVGFGTTVYAVSTLGLENNLVSSEAIGATDGTLNGQGKNPVWLGEAYFTYSAGKTIAKIGRQELNTPLAYSETWNAAPNTFEAAVLINKDLPDTTLVAAYVSRGNGAGLGKGAIGGSTVADGGTFATYGQHLDLTGKITTTDATGAYALGMINKSVSNLTIHPVYYDVVNVAKAFWVDLTYNVPSIATVEAMYAHMEPTGVYSTKDKTDAYAAKVSGAVSGINLAASYASIGDGFLPVGNTATGFATTKVYTAGVGGSTTGFLAGAADSTSWKVEASTKVADVTLGAYYNAVSVGDKGGTTYKNQDVSSVALTAAVKVDEVNLMAAYISESNDKLDDNQIVRVIASINF